MERQVTAKELAQLYRDAVGARDEQLRQMVATAVGEVASAEAFAAEVAVAENAITVNRSAAEGALKGAEFATLETAAAEANVAENTAGVASIAEAGALEAAQFYATLVKEVIHGK
jgi:hypothetical protein